MIAFEQHTKLTVHDTLCSATLLSAESPVAVRAPIEVDVVAVVPAPPPVQEIVLDDPNEQTLT